MFSIKTMQFVKLVLYFLCGDFTSKENLCFGKVA